MSFIIIVQDSAKSVQFGGYHSPAPRLNRQYASVDNSSLKTSPIAAL